MQTFDISTSGGSLKLSSNSYCRSTTVFPVESSIDMQYVARIRSERGEFEHVEIQCSFLAEHQFNARRDRQR